MSHVLPGDKVVTFRYGQFSHLWIDMMERMGLDVTVIDRPWGEGADESILQVKTGAFGACGSVLGLPGLPGDCFLGPEGLPVDWHCWLSRST